MDRKRKDSPLASSRNFSGRKARRDAFGRGLLPPLSLLLAASLSSCNYCSGWTTCEELEEDFIPHGFYEIRGVFAGLPLWAEEETAIPGYLAVGPGRPKKGLEEISYWAEGKDGVPEIDSIRAYPNAIQNRGPVSPGCYPPEPEDFDEARLWLDRGNGMEEVVLYAWEFRVAPFISWALEGNSEEAPLGQRLVGSGSYFPSMALPLGDYRYEGDEYPAYEDRIGLQIWFRTDEGGWASRPAGSSLGEPIPY